MHALQYFSETKLPSIPVCESSLEISLLPGRIIKAPQYLFSTERIHFSFLAAPCVYVHPHVFIMYLLCNICSNAFP